MPEEALRAFGLGPDALLGEGGEAQVYALNGSRVLRVHRPGTSRAAVERRAELYAELGRGRNAVPFELPEVLETEARDDWIVSVERRLPGRAMCDVLREARGDRREALLDAYLTAADRIGDLPLPRPWFGDLLAADPIHTPTQRDYLEARAARSLARAGPGFDAVDAAALARALPEPARGDLVHMDFFPGNVLVDGDGISAVLDFGPVTLIGDRRLDPLGAAIYLAPAMSPAATDADRAFAGRWLAEHGLAAYRDAAERWLAAFWAWAVDDTRLHSWCREVLIA